MVQMNIVVKSLDGRQTTMGVESTFTVQQLKQMIASTYSVDAEQQELLLNAQALDNSRSLFDCNVIDGSEVFVIAQIDGGAKKKKKVFTKPKKNKHKNKKIKLRVLNLYKIEGNGTVVRNRKECPKCGAGYFMAAHKDRYYCGNCHATLPRND